MATDIFRTYETGKFSLYGASTLIDYERNNKTLSVGHHESLVTQSLSPDLKTVLPELICNTTATNKIRTQKNVSYYISNIFSSFKGTVSINNRNYLQSGRYNCILSNENDTILTLIFPVRNQNEASKILLDIT